TSTCLARRPSTSVAATRSRPPTLQSCARWTTFTMRPLPDGHSRPRVGGRRRASRARDGRRCGAPARARVPGVRSVGAPPFRAGTGARAPLPASSSRTSPSGYGHRTGPPDPQAKAREGFEKLGAFWIEGADEGHLGSPSLRRAGVDRNRKVNLGIGGDGEEGAVRVTRVTHPPQHVGRLTEKVIEVAPASLRRLDVAGIPRVVEELAHRRDAATADRRPSLGSDAQAPVVDESLR